MKVKKRDYYDDHLLFLPPKEVSPELYSMRLDGIMEALRNSAVITENKTFGFIDFDACLKASVVPKKAKSTFKVDTKTGKITVKKGLKKGTYKVKIRIHAAESANTKAALKDVTCTIKVK